MRGYSDTRGIFGQLALSESARAVQTVMENHEAWVRSEQVAQELGRIMRARMDLENVRIRLQRERLRPVITVLPRRMASAG